MRSSINLIITLGVWTVGAWSYYFLFWVPAFVNKPELPGFSLFSEIWFTVIFTIMVLYFTYQSSKYDVNEIVRRIKEEINSKHQHNNTNSTNLDPADKGVSEKPFSTSMNSIEEQKALDSRDLNSKEYSSTSLPQLYRKDVIFILFMLVPFYFFIHYIIIPETTDYAFQTVTKFSGTYNNPIFLTFHWKTADELMVGKLTTVWVEVRNLPYTTNETLKDIQIRFKDLNYFSNPYDKANNKISEIDFVTLQPDWNNHIFKSNQINIRYIVPEDVSVDLCDYNKQSECMRIDKVIHPAPHDTFVQIDTARTSTGVSLSILLLSIFVAWSNVRPRYHNSRNLSTNQKKILFIGIGLAIAIIIGIEYYIWYSIGDTS